MSDIEKVDTVKNIKKEKKKMQLSEEEIKRRRERFLKNVKPQLDKYREEKNQKKNYLGALKNLNIFSSSEDEKENKKRNKSPCEKENINNKPEEVKKEKLKKIKTIIKKHDEVLNHILKRTEKMYQMKKQKYKNNNSGCSNKDNNKLDNNKVGDHNDEKIKKLELINDMFKVKPIKLNFN
jgi:hypothetical protein